MAERARILIVEREEAEVWRYGRAMPDGSMAFAGRLSLSPASGTCEPVDGDRDLFVTAALLLRQAGHGDRIVYDLTMTPLTDELRQPARPDQAGGHHRSTAGKAKAPGTTLAARANRDKQGR